ncbi:MAG TPA: calcium-binding protein [Hydrogenophaga sp.]|uniref:calcium-binding protein n=1 Tax=Hydrogenophaga sp. TaxID=1904254 RepID=UPI002D1D2985|nr:calcium-binding protein [Hydrogenophaga sp.]HSX92683.1 calcium-binding protein [Hydrogenophaga sp.]
MAALERAAQEPTFAGDVARSVNDLFAAARSVIPVRDPLVLDLDGDGLELTAASSNVLFDHNADGIKTGTGWARPDDGFLVRDLNGNGSIDSGRELFGVDTEKSNGQLATQGFDALADLDSNGDGQITSADAAWGQLQVWRDVNQDGISQAGELSALDALGITRIGLDGSSSGPQAGQTINNNRVALSATFTRNGVTRTVGAIDLEANGFFSEIPPEVVDEEGNPVVISEAAQALPQMNGSGMVRNLRAAMSLAGTQADELEAAVAAFSAATTRDAQLALIDNLITEWAQTSSYWSSLEGYLGGSVTLTPPSGMTAEQYRNLIGVLEAFNGSRFYAPVGSAMPVGQWGGAINGVTVYSVTPDARQVVFLQQAYEALRESVYEALVVQTRLKPYLDAVELTVDESGVHLDAAGIGVLALQTAQTNASKAITDLVDLRHYFRDTLDGMGWSFGAALAPVLYSVEMTPELFALLVTEKIVRMGAEEATLVVSTAQAGFSVIGNALDNSITGNANGVEYLYGGEGNDTLTSMGQGDVLDGGAGNDTLIAGGLYTTARGGAGNDVLRSSSANLYHMTWEGGTGNDTITGTQYADYYRFNRGDGADFIIDSGQHSMTNASYMDRLVFGEGIDASDLGARRVGNDLVLTVAGVAGDQITIQNMFDNASGNSRIEQIVFADGSIWTHEQLAQLALNTTNASTSGDDTITGTASYSEVISGGEGNDMLTSAGSDDVLDGGAGNDTLIAGGLYTTARGGVGNDVLRSSNSSLYHMTWEGGTGNDTITGTQYADYYRFNRGDGADLISDSGSHLPSNPSYADELRFGEGISASDLGARRVGNDLVLTVAGAAGDQITIQNWFYDTTGTYRIEKLVFADGSTWSHEQLAQLALNTTNASTSGDDTITGTASYSEVVSGGEGNDTLTSAGSGDVLDGGAGNDTLIAGGLYTTARGGAGNDVLRSSSSSLYHMTWEGGTGNDTITGTQYADYYRFNRGDGADLISDSGSHLPTNASYADELRFGEGIGASDLGARRVGNDLVLTVAGVQGDQITIQNWFSGTSGTYRIEKLVFADGSTWSHEQLAQLALNTTNASTSGDDTITGVASYSEAISGGEGNDTLTSAGEGDTLDGGVGDDTLIAGGLYTTLRGGAGNDVLRSSNSSLYHMTWEGGTGNDTITGTNYADYYRFNRGDGADLISDTGSHSPTNPSYADRLTFGEGISEEELWFSRSGNDLLVQVLGDGGQVQIKDWYASSSYLIEEMRLSDGQALLFNQVDALVNAMAAFAPPAPGQTTLTPEQQTALAPVIAAAWN